MTMLCLPNGTQDLENARRTVAEYIISAIQNPSLPGNNMSAKPGTLCLVLPPVPNPTGLQPAMYQKQDDGCTTNWKLVVEGNPPISPSVTLTVDPVNGNDATGNPYKTLAAAFAAAAVIAGPNPGTGALTFPRPAVLALPGVYTEPAPTLPYNVSLIGYGFDCTSINNGLNYVGGVNESARIDIVGIACGNLNIDVALSFNTNIRFINSRCNLSWNGGPNYNITQVNNFLGHASTYGLVTIVDGAVHLYNTQGIFSGLNIQDGPVPTSFPFLELVGGLIQGPITMAGKAQLYARGALNTSTMAGTVVGLNTPLFETDMASLPTGAMSGTFKLHVDDNQVQLGAASILAGGVQRQAVIALNTGAGPLSIQLGKAVNSQGLPLTVKNHGANPLTVLPFAGETIDLAPNLILALLNQARTIISDGAVDWMIVAGYL